MVDTHCHIHSSDTQFEGEESTRKLWEKAGNPSGDSLIMRAKDAGVKQVICVGVTFEDSCLAIDFAKNHENAYASIGIHPHESKVAADFLSTFSLLLSTAPKGRIVAIGECGLDYYYKHSPKEAQVKVLKLQIELALKYDLPVIFHIREAFDDFWPIFDSYNNLRGVLHSFTDTKANLDKAIKRGLYIGVNGICTFTKSGAQKEMFKNIPLSSMLLETDAPYLTPVPMRGKVNEPAFVKHIAEYLANLRSQSLEELSTTTSQNATKLFKLKT